MKKVILAKKFNDIGSIAFNVEDDKTVCDTYPFLSKKSMYSDVQILVIGVLKIIKNTSL